MKENKQNQEFYNCLETALMGAIELDLTSQVKLDVKNSKGQKKTIIIMVQPKEVIK